MLPAPRRTITIAVERSQLPNGRKVWFADAFPGVGSIKTQARWSFLRPRNLEKVIERMAGHEAKTAGQTCGNAWSEVGPAATSKVQPYRVGGL